MQAAGGTELQLKFLYDHVDNDLLDKVQITTSYFGKKIHTINLISTLGLKIRATTINMIGMYLILIGHLKSIECYLIYQLKNAWLLKTGVHLFQKENLSKKAIL